jgi:hypothetical protein
MTDISRRQILQSMVCSSALYPGLLSELLANDLVGTAQSTDGPLAQRPPHFAPKAKRVIFVFATGGASHVDTFDPKHDCDTRFKGRPTKGSIFPFRPDPETGIEISDLFPEIRRVLKHICVVRSMTSAHFDHSESVISMHTGSASITRPSMGSWLSYGLGTENRDLPSFIVMAPALPYGGTRILTNDFLPAYHQGTRVVPGTTPIDNLVRKTRQGRVQELELDLAGRLDREHLQTRSGDSNLAARIHSFETAFRMQTSGPECFDVSSESKATLSLYGLQRGDTNSFAWQCLTARRMAERGVRFIELIDSGSMFLGKNANWDSHSNIQDHQRLADKVDRPIAGLIRDLDHRGMLDETLIVWATEFGRTVWLEGKGNRGRGHHGDCFSIWLAGGGIRPGIVYGETNEIGSEIVSGKMDVHDLHATILHLMGIDHTRLTYRHAGRDFRLTDVHGHIVHEILA